MGYINFKAEDKLIFDASLNTFAYKTSLNVESF